MKLAEDQWLNVDTAKEATKSLEQTNEIDHLNAKVEPGAAGETQQTSTQAVVNLLKAAIDNTIVMPYMFMKCGYTIGISALILTAIPSLYSWLNLLSSFNTLIGEEYDYASAARAILGRRHARFLKIMVPVFNGVYNINYFIIMFQCLKDFLSWTHYNASDLQLFLLVMLFFVPASMIQSLSNLAWLNYFGIACFFTIMGIVFANSINTITEMQIAKNQNSLAQNFKQIPSFFGVILFTYDVSGILGNVRQSLAAPKQNMKKVVLVYIFCMFANATILGISCSMAYGKETKQIVFLNLETQSEFYYVLTKILDILFSISLFLSNIIYNFPISALLDQQLAQITPHSAHNQTLARFGGGAMRALARGLVYTFEAGIAINCTDIVKTMNVIGCIFTVLLGYVYPYLFYQKVFSYKMSARKRVTNTAVLLFSIVMGGLGVYCTIKLD